MNTLARIRVVTALPVHVVQRLVIASVDRLLPGAVRFRVTASYRVQVG